MSERLYELKSLRLIGEVFFKNDIGINRFGTHVFATQSVPHRVNWRNILCYGRFESRRPRPYSWID